MLLECPVPVRDRPGDGDVPEGRDDPDGPEEDEDVVPLEDKVEGAGTVLVEHAGRLGTRGAVGECLRLTRVPSLVHVSCQWRRAVLFLPKNETSWL